MKRDYLRIYDVLFFCAKLIVFNFVETLRFLKDSFIEILCIGVSIKHIHTYWYYCYKGMVLR